MTQTTHASFGQPVVVPLACAGDATARVRQWRLIALAGEGSLAKVYRASPANAPEDVLAAYAVKILRPQWSNDPAAIRLLQQEALAGASVSHPHVVPILSAHVLEPPRLLVMPWLEGTTLAARLASGVPLDLAEVFWIARQTAEALAAFHAAGWMHGDVTPGNIHLSPTGHVTLIDMSFARPCREVGSAADRPILGTCNYIAPEQITSTLRADIRGDIYSLGCVLFEMLAGRPPYRAKDLADLATQHRQSAMPDLFHLAPHLPSEVFALVRQMLAKDPLRRPQTPQELVNRLVALEIAAFADRLR